MEKSIEVTQDETGKFWVMGRNLCRAISTYQDPENQFSRWISVRLKPFKEGRDYLYFPKFPNPKFSPGSNNRQLLQEYKLTIRTAKRIAELEGVQWAVEFFESYERGIPEASNSNSGSVNHANAGGVSLLFDAPEPTPNPPLLAINPHSILGNSVSGRELYQRIAQSSSNSIRDGFSDWFRSLEKKLNLVQGKDFVVLHSGFLQPQGGRRLIEFILSIEAAKKIAQNQNAGKGAACLAFLYDYQHEATSKEQQPVPSQPAAQTAPSIIKPSTPNFRHQHEDDQSVSVASKNDSPDAAQSSTSPVIPTAPSALQQLLMDVQKAADNEKILRTLGDRFNAHDEQLKAMGSKLDIVINFFVEATKALLGEQSTGVPVGIAASPASQEDSNLLVDELLESHESGAEAPPSDSPRAKLVRIVNDFADHSKVEYKDIWRWLYNQLYTTYSFNVSRHKSDKEKYLDAAERHGQLPNLYSIAQTQLLPKMGVKTGAVAQA